ncbi:MAG: MCE family protein [Candidatus Nealsonbacteria bacterium]|nr:MCE family protein [Candidatus Nealsonbacteria bacterium]
MDERQLQLRVGVMALATLLIAGILLVMFGELPRFGRGGYTVTIHLDSAPGLTKDTPILKSGIRIGRVSDVRFAYDKDKHEIVKVTAEIDGNRRLFKHDVCYVSRSVLGDTSLEFHRVGRPEEYTPLEDGAVLEGKVSQDPTGLMNALEQPIQTVQYTGQALADASASLKTAADKITVLVETNETAITETIAEARATLESVHRVADVADRLIGDEESQKQIREALNQLPGTLVQVKKTMDLAVANLENLQEFTGPLSEGAGERVEKIDNAVVQMDAVLTQLALFSEALNNRDSSLGRLVHDEELYFHLNRAAKNVDDLTRQMKPILADVRVFSDKIARHPGVVVRDAVRPGAGIK